MNKNSFEIIKKSLVDTEYLMKAINSNHPSRELSLAITKIQESIMWFDKIEIKEENNTK